MAQRGQQSESFSQATGEAQASSYASHQTVLGPRHRSSGILSGSHNLAQSSSRDQIVGSDFRTTTRRRSSFAERFSSIRQMGGPNNIDNFVNSIQRAAAFREITPAITYEVHAVFSDDEDEGDEEDGVSQHPSDNQQQKSLLSEQVRRYEHRGSTGSSRPDAAKGAITIPTSEITALLSGHPRLSWSAQSRLSQDHLLGTSYSSISHNLSQSARRRVSILEREQAQVTHALAEVSTKDEILVPQHIAIETLPDGEVIERIVGESTMPMTIFNSINVMLGVGVLAIPLGFHLAGFLAGGIMLILIAITTEYTARLLAKCMDTNFASSSYTDIAFIAFGPLGRSFVEVIFFLELVISNVAYVILFGDSIHSIADGISTVSAEIVITLALLPLNFVPLKYLSITSVLGISSILGIIILLLAAGVNKPEAPGSLRHPIAPNAFPSDFKIIALTYGLLMAPLSGHPIFPAIYKDMRHPYKYKRALRMTYGFMICVNLGIILLGCLMFGKTICGSVTTNILKSDAYPKILSVILLIMIGLIPVTKLPLYNRAMIDTINKKLVGDSKSGETESRPFRHKLVQWSTAILINVFLLGFALVCPSFNSVVGILGSALCGLNCIILPVSFYLKIFWGSDEIKLAEKLLCYFLILVAVFFGITGTIVSTLSLYKASC